jgi:hypothetical protein
VAESWRLKVDRANHHFGDLKRELAAYAGDQRYDLIPADASPKCDEHRGVCWDYKLTMGHKPSPQLAILAGDVLFNLRSALDHIAAALVPSNRRGKTQFPIESEGIWEKKGRRYVIRNPGGRRRFRFYTEGMPDEAVAIIKRLQPYHGIQAGVDQQALYQLNRLNNADKHRNLTVFIAGLINVIYEINVGGVFARDVSRDRLGNLGLARDNAHVFHFIPKGAVPMRSDVKVQISGTPVVGIKTVNPHGKSQSAEGVMNVELLFSNLLDHIPDILTALEPFVRNRAASRPRMPPAIRWDQLHDDAS